MDELKNAYFAGLIDGEGTIAVYKFSSGMTRAIVKVDMTCEKTVRSLHDHFGGYIGVKKVEENTNRKPQWHWEVTHKKALEVCKLLRPFLVTKAENADHVISTRSKKRPTIAAGL